MVPKDDTADVTASCTMIAIISQNTNFETDEVGKGGVLLDWWIQIGREIQLASVDLLRTTGL